MTEFGASASAREGPASQSGAQGRVQLEAQNSWDKGMEAKHKGGIMNHEIDEFDRL